MPLRKDKNKNLIVRPEEKNQIAVGRSFDLWSDMDKLFDDFRTNFDSLLWPWSTQRGPLTTMTQQRMPLMDVADHGDHYTMNVEIPGIPKDNIDIQVTPTGVEISAEHDQASQDKDKNWLRRERSSMKFYRSLELPEELNTENVNAEFKDGILTLTLHKMEPTPEHKPTKVKIK